MFDDDVEVVEAPAAGAYVPQAAANGASVEFNEADLYAEETVEEVDEESALTDRLPPVWPGTWRARLRLVESKMGYVKIRDKKTGAIVMEDGKPKRGAPFANVAIEATLSAPGWDFDGWKRKTNVLSLYDHIRKTSAMDDAIKAIQGHKLGNVTVGVKRDKFVELLKSEPWVGVVVDWEATWPGKDAKGDYFKPFFKSWRQFPVDKEDKSALFPEGAPQPIYVDNKGNPATTRDVITAIVADPGKGE